MSYSLDWLDNPCMWSLLYTKLSLSVLRSNSMRNLLYHSQPRSPLFNKKQWKKRTGKVIDRCGYVQRVPKLNKISFKDFSLQSKSSFQLTFRTLSGYPRWRGKEMKLKLQRNQNLTPRLRTAGSLNMSLQHLVLKSGAIDSKHGWQTLSPLTLLAIFLAHI